MSGVTTALLGWVMLSPTTAPVPPDPLPDPLGRGYLGASFDSSIPGSPPVIATVTPGLPAAKAGLQQGDEVVRVGTCRPQSFNELLGCICSYRPGAVVELEVKRHGELKIVRVTLAARPPELDIPRDPAIP